MALIRHAEARSLVRDAVPIDLGDMQARAEDLKARAIAEAERVVKEAHAERARLISDAAEVGHKQGYAAGFDEGLGDGTKQGRSEAILQRMELLKVIEDGWSSTLIEMEQQRAMLFEDARDDVIELAIEIARRVVGVKIQSDPRTVEASLDACLSSLRRRSKIVVRIHPDDVEVVRESLPGMIAVFEACESSEIVADSDVTVGSAIVTTDRGATIGGPLEEQVEAIARLLLPARTKTPKANTQTPDVEVPPDASVDA